MAHKGLREFTGEEASNQFLGQRGFHVLVGDSEVTAASKGVSFWVAIKAVDGAAGVKANSYGDGDDLTVTGAYAGAEITLADGDIVYGAFDKITVGETDEYVLAYIGK